jgi:Ca2+-binding EF-hand superfamily protein
MSRSETQQIAKHFNEIDTDHHGQISQDELHVYFKAQHEKSQS